MFVVSFILFTTKNIRNDLMKINILILSLIAVFFFQCSQSGSKKVDEFLDNNKTIVHKYEDRVSRNSISVRDVNEINIILSNINVKASELKGTEHWSSSQEKRLLNLIERFQGIVTKMSISKPSLNN